MCLRPYLSRPQWKAGLSVVCHPFEKKTDQVENIHDDDKKHSKEDQRTLGRSVVGATEESAAFMLLPPEAGTITDEWEVLVALSAGSRTSQQVPEGRRQRNSSG